MYEILIGAAVSGIAQVSKKFGLDQKYVVTALAIIGAVSYYFYSNYVSVDLQDHIVESFAKIAGSSTVFYNAIKIAMEQANKSK